MLCIGLRLLRMLTASVLRLALLLLLMLLLGRPALRVHLLLRRSLRLHLPLRLLGLLVLRRPALRVHLRLRSSLRLLLRLLALGRSALRLLHRLARSPLHHLLLLLLDGRSLGVLLLMLTGGPLLELLLTLHLLLLLLPLLALMLGGSLRGLLLLLLLLRRRRRSCLGHVSRGPGRAPGLLCLELLAHHRVAGPVVVVPALERLLLLGLGIAITRIAPLIDGERSGPRGRAAVPVIPPASLRLPFMTPVLAPVRRVVVAPAAEVRRRLPVVANGDAQDVQRYVLGIHGTPRTVVPGARIPAIPVVDPVEAVVEEVVRIDARRVIDRISGHRHELREQRQVDADAHVGKPDPDAHLRLGRSRRTRQQQRASDEAAGEMFGVHGVSLLGEQLASRRRARRLASSRTWRARPSLLEMAGGRGERRYTACGMRVEFVETSVGSARCMSPGLLLRLSVLLRKRRSKKQANAETAW